ncbi:putative membrane protein [Mucinivorans hirudinis]|uniref:Putative membrane protein n=1 Tax=Mucinivorans hirudinis TaxID=1433126 RepID=A0A060RBW5_9BACT|nr:putative membrane protein [Mucinivorans hirudinis]
MKLLIIDRYIIKKFLITYFFAIAMICVIVVIFDAAENAQDFLAAHISFSKILTGYYLNFIPYFVNQLSGLFTFIAVIFFTSKMAYDTEIIAILSSGVSFKRLMWPYFVAAFVIAAISLTLNLFVIPETNKRRIDFDNTYRNANKREQNMSTGNVYRQIGSNTFAYIKDYYPASKRASYLSIESYDGGRIISAVEAQDATYNEESGRWSAAKYITRVFDGEQENFVKHEERLDTAINLTAQELGKTEDLVQILNAVELSHFIDQQRYKGSDMVVLFEIESYSRYAYPFSTFILTLIGVSLSSRKVRGGTGLHIGVGIALCFSYIVLMRFAGEFAKTNLLPSWLAIWSPNIIYLIIGIYLYKKAPK